MVLRPERASRLFVVRQILVLGILSVERTLLLVACDESISRPARTREVTRCQYGGNSEDRY
jgi:hypothetical protein